MTEINMALLNDFIDESREHLDEMESLLLQLGGDLGNLDILNDIFRTMHNVKGASQLTGLDRISRLSHRLEDLLDLLRQGMRQTTSEIVELLIDGRDRIVTLVAELESSQKEISSVDELIEQLTSLIERGEAAVTPAVSAEQPAAQVTAPATGMFDNHEEESDEELYKIFIEHLQEQFSLLTSANDQLEQHPTDKELIRECLDSVAHLKSSANYMGYDELTELFRNWQASLEEALNELSAGHEPYLEFMQVYTDELVTRYPLLEQYRAVPYAQRGESAQASEPVVEKAQIPVETAHSVQDEPIPEHVINMVMLPDFIEESREHLHEMEALLLQLGHEHDNLDLLNDIFRTMHNVKGASQLTGLDKISRLSHRLEDLLDLLRQGQMKTNQVIVNLLIAGRDRIAAIVTELESYEQEQSSVDELIEQLTMLINSSAQSTSTSSVADATRSMPAASTGSAINFDEEHDRELFDIFLEHLKEQYSVLESASAHFKHVPADVEHLQECLGAVQHLKSSANYMGYDELVSFFSNWSHTLQDSQQDIALGNGTVLDFMDVYLDELRQFFPVLGELTVPSFQDTQTPQPKVEDTKLSVAVTPEPEKQQDAALFNVSSSIQDINQDMKQSHLFNMLNNALDESMQSVSDSEYETLNNVFDELVSSTSSDSETLAAAKQNALKAAKRSSGRTQPSEQQAKDSESRDKKIKKTLRVDSEKIDALMNQVGELVVDRSYFYQLFNEMRDLQQYLKEVTGVDQKELKMFRAFTYRLSEAISSLGRTSNELQEGVMKMRMLPISHLFNRYPRLVHDLTANTEKKVNLILRGEETELDKMIVEELSDPLIHIIRNAIDHGIESAEDRARAGKEAVGKLILEAYQESNHIVIEVTDDGRGLNPEKIKAKALSKELFTAEELDRMIPREIINLVLMPGFSTADKITGTSGRGVGMDVVKKNIEKLNGTLDIDTRPGKGTQMRLKIPLTLAIIHALMVRVGGDMFTIPLANVDETVRISKDDASYVEGVEVIHLRGVALPIFRLSNLFGVKSDHNLDKSFVVIVNTDGQRVGFVVDELMGQEEVVIKPLEDYVQEKSGFSGATIIGDGRISLILDVYELVKMTASRQIRRHKEQARMLKASTSTLLKKQGESRDTLH